MKFKVGDRIRNKETGKFDTVKSLPGMSEYDKGNYISADDGMLTANSGWEFRKDWELIKQGATMSRRTFRLLKETERLKKGAIVQEKCEDGDQEYQLQDVSYRKFEDLADYSLNPLALFSRNEVEQNPKWFQEVFPASEVWLTKDELKAFKDWQKTRAKKSKR